MEFTDENGLSVSKMRKEGSETRSHHRRYHRRSSSILKVPQSKLPLTDVDVNQQDDVRVPPLKKARKSENRRVSFADTCQIKEFPKDSPGAWHQENSSAENSPSLEETIEQEKPEISGLDKLLTGSIQHPGFSYAEEEVPLGEEGQSLGVQVDPVNHTLIVNDEMELTGVPGLVDEPPDDFGESQGQNNKVDYNFLRSLVSSDKKANCELHIEKPEKLFHVKSKESPETFVYTTMNRYSCLYEENIQSTLSVLTSGTTTLSDQVSMSSRAPLMAVPSSLKPGLNTTVNDVDSLGELESNLHVQTGAEKPKATGFLKSLLKSEKKDGDNAVFFAQSSSSVSQHERTQIFGSGDGMDETAVLDNTIWTTEKRDLSRTEGLLQNHVTMEKVSVESNCEKTQVFHSGDAMEETKVFTGTIWTKEEISVQEVEKTQIFDGNGKMDMMEETKVLSGGIWMGSDGKADVEVEKTKIFGMEDQMEETKVLTGGIWTGETKTNDKTRTVDLMEETKPLTGLTMFEHPNQSSNSERATKIDEYSDKTKNFAQDKMDDTEVVSSSILKTEKEDSLTDIGNNQNLNVAVSKENLNELKEDDSDEEVTFNIKKTFTGSETLSNKDNTLKEVREQDPDTEQSEKDKQSEVTVGDKDDGNTKSLADLKARLKEHTSRFDDTLLRPEERQSKTNNDFVMSSQIQTNFGVLDLDKKPQNETLMFSNKSAMLEETKMMTTSIEAVSQLPKKPQNQTLMFSNKSAMLEETKMVTTSIETGSSKEEFDMPKPVENQTVMFDDGNAMMEETKAVTSNLIIEPELPSSAGASSSLVKKTSEMVDKLPTMAGGNMTVFFGNDTGAMEETKMATTAVGPLTTSSGKNNGLPLMDIPKLPDEGVISGSVMNTTNTTRSDEKLEGLMEISMQGLLEQAPPESLLTDLTLNSTALSFRPPSTSSQGVAASPVDSTQALLGKDWDNVTLPGNNSTLHGDMTFPRDSVMVTGEGEKSLISQLSINKTLDCDVTQEDIWDGPMTALSLCNYLHVIVPSCLKVSITELRKTRCSFIQEEDIPCEDLRSKLSALLTVQPHIEAQTEINAQLMAEVEKKKLELEALEEAWSTEPPEIFQFAQTCSQSQKEELREKMMTMSNTCTRRGKIEWKRATLQAAKLELEKIQERNRRLNVEVELTLQMATEAVQDMEQVSQELIAIGKEFQEMQNTPSLSEEEIQEYCVEKASLERKQSELLNIKNEELNINEDNNRMAGECEALARRLSESAQLESERDDIQALEKQSQKVGQEIQLLCGMSGWHLNEDSFKRNHKVFLLERNKLKLEVKHNNDSILSIEMRTCDTDGLSCREQFCYKLVTDAVNGRYLGQKYRQLSSLPKILQEVGSVVSHANSLQYNLLQLQLDHCIVFKYPSLHLEVWSPKKRCVDVSFLFLHMADSLLWSIEPSLSVMHGNLRMDALLSQISQVCLFPENSYLNRVCAAVDLESIQEETHPKCSLCGTVQA